jgi:hypothetical protein
MAVLMLYLNSLYFLTHPRSCYVCLLLRGFLFSMTTCSVSQRTVCRPVLKVAVLRGYISRCKGLVNIITKCSLILKLLGHIRKL